MSEFGQQIFTFKMITIQVVSKRAIRLRTFVYAKKIFSLFFIQLYFNLIIDTKIKPKLVVQLPAKLVPFKRCYNAEQSRIFKKIICQIIYVELEFHNRKCGNVEI